MLDEKIEAEEYLSGKRINIRHLTKNFDKDCKLVGLDSIMSVLARDFIDKVVDEMKGKTPNYKELGPYSSALLGQWLGIYADMKESTETSVAKSETQKAAKKVLAQYSPYKEVIPKLYEAQQDKKTVTVNWDTYCKKYVERLNSGFAYHISAVSYESAFSTALQKKTLSRRYLKINTGVLDKYLKDKSRKIKPGENLKAPTKSTLTKFLKLAAAYLILKENHPKQSYVLFDKTRVLDWSDIQDTNFGSFISKFVYERDGVNVPVFDRISGEAYSKFMVDSIFLEEMGAEILTEEMLKGNMCGCEVYRDTGVTEIERII